MTCELCSQPAAIIVQWCSKSSPWTAPLCAEHVRETWDGCVRIGNTDGWSMQAVEDVKT